MTGPAAGFKALVVVYSYHHHNTEKVARAMAEVLGAEVKAPKDVRPGELAGYDLVGFGSGIYSDAPHPDLIALAQASPAVWRTPAFVFCTMGAPMRGEAGSEYAAKCQARLKGLLKGTGYRVLGEFHCVGWNTNSFLKLVGGMHRGRPNEQDLARAREFAAEMRRKAGQRVSSR